MGTGLGTRAEQDGPVLPWVEGASKARLLAGLVGGKDAFAVERGLARTVLLAAPELPDSLREAGEFVGRALAWASRERAVGALLVVDGGFPGDGVVAEAARAGAAPWRSVTVTGSDPMALAHARALLPGTCGELRTVITVPVSAAKVPGEVRGATAPVAVVLTGVLEALMTWKARALLAGLAQVLPTGSTLVLTHLSAGVGVAGARALGEAFAAVGTDFCLRTPEQLLGLLPRGAELVGPGVCPAADWAPDAAPAPPGPIRCAAVVATLTLSDATQDGWGRP